MEEKCKPFVGFNSIEYTNPDLQGIQSLMLKEQKPTVLLHACCGPCATACVERLAFDYSVTVYYYNPNITDPEEYFLRRDNLVKFIDAFNEEYKGETVVNYVEGPYEPEAYIRRVQSLVNEPEGGKRCDVCFEMRLADTARMAQEMQMDYFTTTLTVSPHKNFAAITAVGEAFAESINPDYLAIDFKKKNGFGRSVELSKKYGLYRQRFCGCEYARGDR